MNNSDPDNSIRDLVSTCADNAMTRLLAAANGLKQSGSAKFLSSQLVVLRQKLGAALSDTALLDNAGTGRSSAAAEPSGENVFGAPGETESTAGIQANVGAARQAIRSLNDLCRRHYPHATGTLARVEIEFELLERAILLSMFSRSNLSGSGLYVLTSCVLNGDAASLADEKSCKTNEQAFAARINQLIEGGAEFIQLRDKRLDDRELIRAGRMLTELTRNTNTRWIMNDRTDLALVTGADGVHLGQEDIPVSSARQMLGAAGLIGVSTHNIDQARQAVLDGANYIGVGPVFPSTTKTFAAFPGLEFVEEVAAEISLPAFAIGGIDSDNLIDIVRAGMRRVAVSSAVCNADDVKQAAEAFVTKLQLD